MTYSKMNTLLNRSAFWPLAWFVAATLLLSSCDSYVEDIDVPIDTVGDEQFTSESDLPFLMNGIKSRAAHSLAFTGILAGGLSDEHIHSSNAPLATFPEYEEVDHGEILVSNFVTEFTFGILGEMRFYSDNILERISGWTFDDPGLEQEVRFTAHLYAGFARFMFATFWGLNPSEGGGVISNGVTDLGSFIPSDEMYDLALSEFEKALNHAGGYETRLVNTMMARIALFSGDEVAAAAFAAHGLMQGDAPLEFPFAVEFANEWIWQAGHRRAQLVVDPRFPAYVADDPAEANRIPLAASPSLDGSPLFVQALYPSEDSPVRMTSWQENELMLAELALGAGDAASALDHVNKVRQSHGISPLTSVDMDVLIEERDKELFTTGLRLPDQRRFGIWHLGPGKWQFLPIPLTERSQNPNL